MKANYIHRVHMLKNRLDRKRQEFCDLHQIAKINADLGLPDKYREVFEENVKGFKFNIQNYFKEIRKLN